MTRLRSLGLLAMVLTASACDEAAAPEGRRGTLTVTAYVDADASGSLTAPDDRIGGLTIALFRGGAQATTSTTNDQGVATFVDLPPGSYEVRLIGAVPEGMALVTNPAPSAAISFQGSDARVEYRFVHFPGTIAGRIFRDNDASGAFEPATDTPGAGLSVFLRRDIGGAPGDTVDVAVSGPLGEYVFNTVAPGSYFLEFQRSGTIDFGASGATRRVVVVGRQTVAMDAVFTGSLVLSIEEARTQPAGTGVAVVGSVIVPPNIFTSGTGGVNSEIWVQDATGGIAVFPVPSASTLVLGDSVEVSGPLSAFNGQLQIGTTASPPAVTPRSGRAVVAPKAITAAEARSRADEGRLVAVSGLTVVAVGGGTSSAFNVTTVSAADDTLIIRVAGANTGLTRSSFAVGSPHTITGVLTQFNGAAQIKPRFASDVSVGSTGVARVIINELMPNPNAVSDAAGEYIELHNWGTAPADLQGWTIRDNFGVDTIDVSLVIPAGGYAVLAPNGDPAANGGLTVAFVYVSTIGLAQGGDRVVLKDPSGATVDSVAYASSSGAVAGVARGVKDPSADNTDVLGTNWEPQASSYGSGSPPDKGTPGAQNDGYVAPTAPAGARAAGASPLGHADRARSSRPRVHAP